MQKKEGGISQIKKRLSAFLPLPILIAGVLYMGGIVSQFLRNYSQWSGSGGIPGMESSPKLPSLDYPTAFLSCFSDLYGLAGLSVCVLTLAVFWFGIMHLGAKGSGVRDEERNLTYSRKGTYGTASFLSDEALKRTVHLENSAETTTETILGKLGEKLVCLPKDSYMNRNIAVCGPPGSRKTRSFTRNMMFQCVRRGESLIITDPKGEIYDDFRDYLEQQGYEVRVFNTIQPENSDAWDLVGEVRGEDLSAQIISDVMIRGTGGASGNQFWDNGEQNLLKSLLLYADSSEERSTKLLYDSIAASNGLTLATTIFSLPKSHPSKLPFKIFMAQDEVTRGKMINGLGTRLQVFQNQAVCDMTSYPEIDLSLPGVKKCAYFCISSDQHSAFDFLTSLFITFSFIRLVELADRLPEKRLPVPVHILGEEAPNFCSLSGLGKRLSVVRSRGISMSVVFQSIPQMQNRFPNNEWLEILSDCDVKLYLGCTDPVTAKYVSDRSGTASVEVSSESKALNSWRVSDYTPQYRRTESIGRRQILTPDEVMRLAPDEEIIELRGQDILKAEKFDYMDHPDSRFLRPCNMSEHIPAWRAMKAKSSSVPTEDFEAFERSTPKTEKTIPLADVDGLPLGMELSAVHIERRK